MKFRKLILLGFFLSDFAWGGIGLNTTRIIYNADQKGASVIIRNDGDDVLAQSWIESEIEGEVPPFMITPPLAKVAAKGEQLLRVVLMDAKSLPQDRESVFWLNVQEIPLKHQGKAVIQFAVRQRIKLFYRPETLSSQSVVDAVKSVVMNVVGDKVIITNKSPFNININEVKINGHTYSPGILPPLNKIMINARDKSGKDFVLSVINDYGGLTNYVGYWDGGVIKFREKI